MDASSFAYGPSGPAAAGSIGPLSSTLQTVAAGVEAQSAFASADPAPSLVPTLGQLLEPEWSPYGALVPSLRLPAHNFLAGALLFDATA